MVDRASIQDPSLSATDNDDKPSPYSEQHEAPPPYSEQQLGYLVPSPHQAQPGPYTRQIYLSVPGGGFPAAQPAAFIAQPVQPSLQAPLRDYQWLSWFSCLCCCWPVGAMAILRSNEVLSALASGDYSSAKVASDSARRLAYLAVSLGVGILVGNLIVWIVVYAVLWAR